MRPSIVPKTSQLAISSLLTVLLLCIVAVWRGASAAPAPFVTRSGATLVSNGEPFVFTGINAFSLGSLDGVNAGCGPMYSDEQLHTFFGSLSPDSVVRFWAFQSIAYNRQSGTHDFAGIDRVIETAAQYRVRVIMTLGNQWKDCDDQQEKTERWYQQGYREVHNQSGATPLSYWDYLHLIVPRYADSPTVAMWEPMNEPEPLTGGPCSPTAAQTLRTFFDTVGGEIKRLDPNHLISSGLIGTGQCGSAGSEYQFVHESPSIDVASYHDYGLDDKPLPGDTWNGLQVRLSQAGASNKPLMIGEAGIMAYDTDPACVSRAARRDLLRAKLENQIAAGAVGFMPWSYMPTASGGCDYTISANDPVMDLLSSYQPSRGSPQAYLPLVIVD